jgi:WXG100 family type VII secretion target
MELSNYIKVNHREFESAADAIDTYVKNHNKNMDAARQEVKTLSATWQGKDSTQFQQQWDQVTEADSTSRNMTKALENYADFLRYAAGQYKDAQSKAVNRANSL